MENNLNNVTLLFIEKYKELDEIKQNKKDLYDCFYNKERNLFECIKNTRNVLSHKTINNEYPIFVNKLLLNQMDNLLKRMKEKAIHKAIRTSEMFTAKLDDNLKDVLYKMEKENYSYIPILNDNNTLVGVLTENTIITYIVNNNIGILVDGTQKVKELESFIKIDKNSNELFEFVSEETLLCDTEALFINSYKNNKRLAVIYITHNGNINEKILGMLTAWDVLGKDN